MKARTIFYFIGLLLGGLLFLYFLGRGIQSIVLSKIEFRLPALLLFAWLGMVLVIPMQMFNWRMIMSSLGYRLPFRDVAKGYILSFLPRYIPGTIWGYLSRGEWFYRENGVPNSINNYGSVIEVLIALISAIMVVGGYNLALIADVNQRIVSIFLIGLLPVITWLLLNRLTRLPPFIKKKFERFLSINSGISFASWCGGVFVFCLEWIVYGCVVLFLIGTIIPIPTFLNLLSNLSGLWTCIYAFSFAWMVGFIILFVPGGIGIREFVLTGILISGFAIGYDQAVLVSVLSRIFYSLGEATWILVGWLLNKGPVRNNTKALLK